MKIRKGERKRVREEFESKETSRNRMYIVERKVGISEVVDLKRRPSERGNLSP